MLGLLQHHVLQAVGCSLQQEAAVQDALQQAQPQHREQPRVHKQPIQLDV